MSEPVIGAPKYRRIMLKLGGEALSGQGDFGIDPRQATRIAGIIKRVRHYGVEVAITIGGGNLWRGQTGLEAGMERATADHMGMIATVMNGLALQDALGKQGVATRVQTAIEMRQIAEPYIRLRAIRHLEKGRVVILAGGTGNPIFTTDTAAALRAVEIDAEVLIKATKVDGVYDRDPKTSPEAHKYDRLPYMDFLNLRLEVMDATAITLCRENNLPILVLNLWTEGMLEQALLGEQVGTIIS